jgi:ABC-type polysaccharide/polyol phosphate transport system ATPase subunit
MSTSAASGDRLPAVVARSVSKSFTIPEENVHTLKERAMLRVRHPRRKVRSTTYQALKDVSFAVEPGEFFGIVGRNGCGKSTLLKCMAGIYRADGDIWVRGRLSTLIELGVGFNMELPAKENVVMNGIMLGLSPREARRRVDSVIEFAELQEFRDLKLKNYSSGMQVRLAFSVAIQVDADILMIDEVLAVGDANFQQKCFDVFNNLRDQGKTIILVTHDMTAMQRFCHRAMLMERGDQLYVGEAHEVADRYLELNFGREADGAEGGHTGDGDARVLELWLENATGERLTSAAQHSPITIKARVRFMVDVADPSSSLYIYNEEHRAVTIASTLNENDRTGEFRAGEEVVFSFAFDNVLAPGRYSPVVELAHRGSGLDVIDRYASSFSFIVTGAAALGGIIDLPVRSSMERVTRIDEGRNDA